VYWRKNKVKNGKIIVLCMCALAIGIATTLPLTYFTPRPAATAQTFGEPWFTMQLPSAYLNAYLTDDIFQTEVEFTFPLSINYAVLNQHTGARIEYFEFIFYTDNLQLSRHRYFVAMNSTDISVDLIDSATKNFFSIRENIFNITFPAFGIGGNGGSYFCYPQNQSHIFNGGLGSLRSYNVVDGDYSSIIGNGVSETAGDILNVMENEQVIYLDVISWGYTLIDDNDTVIVSTDNQVIYHIELTNSGNGFTFGDATLPTYEPGMCGTYSTTKR
jgi:hypothetical protein